MPRGDFLSAQDTVEHSSGSVTPTRTRSSRASRPSWRRRRPFACHTLRPPIPNRRKPRRVLKTKLLTTSRWNTRRPLVGPSMAPAAWELRPTAGAMDNMDAQSRRFCLFVCELHRVSHSLRARTRLADGRQGLDASSSSHEQARLGGNPGPSRPEQGFGQVLAPPRIAAARGARGPRRASVRVRGSF